MKQAKGQNKLFQHASLLTCCCSFENGQIKILKTERFSIELLLKVQIRPDYPMSSTN